MAIPQQCSSVTAPHPDISCDVLPDICKLSLVFQQREVDLLVVQAHFHATLDCISVYEDNPTPSLSALEAELRDSLRELGIRATPEKKVQFSNNVQKKYIQALEEHLESRLPDTELLDAFSIFDPPNKTRIICRACKSLFSNTACMILHLLRKTH